MARTEPKLLSAAPRETLARVRAVFFDIDDTFSGSGRDHALSAGGAALPQADWRISDTAYAALWRLYKAGVHVVPVTGRPAGWCDMITRMWPVSAVVGENGAFYSYIDSSKKPPRLVKKYLESPAVRAKNAKALKTLHKEILRKFPGAKTPSDQSFREFDLAIDYCEDVPRWSDERVQRLLEHCMSRGAQAKLSSIHVNTWFGRYDKWTCVRRVLKNLFHIDPAQDILSVMYIGDSPNDEPFFKAVPLSVGVANVRKFLSRMDSAPAYITEKASGDGFAELADAILSARDRS